VHCIDQLQRGQHAVDQVFATRSKAFTVMKSVSGHTSDGILEKLKGGSKSLRKGGGALSSATSLQTACSLSS